MEDEPQTAEDLIMEVLADIAEDPARKVVIIYVQKDIICVKANTTRHEAIGMLRYAQLEAESPWR